MGKVVVSQFVTLDGVFENPGGGEEFDRGGWAFQFNRGDDGDQFKLDEVMASEVLLLGRVTYEGFAAAWPSRRGEFADKFNGMPKYVVSASLTDPEWNNSHVISPENLVEEVRRVREESDGDVLVNGSGQLVAALRDSGLVDEYRLMVFPVVLGAGRRLFAEAEESSPLRLTEARPVGPDGVVILTYQPARKEETDK